MRESAGPGDGGPTAGSATTTETTRLSKRHGRIPAIDKADRPPGQTAAGQVAVVTGAGRGIGRALALRLAEAGARVVCAARTASEIAKTADTIVRRGGESLAVVTDVRLEADVDRLMQETISAFGRLDIAVLNAGFSPAHVSVDDVSPDAWRDCMDTNLTGVFLGIRAAVPHLRAAGGGKIVVVGSGAWRRAPAGMSAYSASKAAVSTLVRVAARDLRVSNIAVNELQPGPTATALHGVRESDPDTLSSREVVLDEGLEDDFSLTGEWFKSPRDVADFAMSIIDLPNHGPSGQIFSLNSVI